MRRRYDRRREQAPDPNWRQSRDTSRCTRIQDGKHRQFFAMPLPVNASPIQQLSGAPSEPPVPQPAPQLAEDERKKAELSADLDMIRRQRGW